MVRAWWGAMQNWFSADDRTTKVIEYALTIALITVAAVAGVLLVITTHRPIDPAKRALGGKPIDKDNILGRAD